jgi:hypothetical protein
VTRERLNRLILLFGESQKREMRAERRDMLRSVLFDLPRRSSLGWQALYEHEVPFLRELTARASPEEIGRAMRAPGSRPYALQLFILMCTYLGARQQRMLDLGLREGERFPEEREDELATLVDFWARATLAYRTDGLLLPSEAGGAQPVLDEEGLAPVRAALRPVDGDRLARVRRAAATVELYSFVLHGEQRDGLFGHGPYPGEEGRVLFLREFNDLRNDYLPWAAVAPATRNPFDALALAYECRDVAVRCDMFGGLVTEPLEFHDRLERLAVLGRRGGELTPLDDAAVEDVRREAEESQTALYMAAVEWDAAYKIAYGAPLFANHLAPFFALVGDGGGARERIMRACQATAERMVDGLLADEAVPSVWRHMGTTEGAFFWPVAS